MKETIWDIYVDSIRPFFRFRFWAKLVLVLAAGAAFAAAGYLAFEHWNINLQSSGDPDSKRMASAWTIVAALSAGAFALWRWTVDQRWRRVQYAQQLLTEFFSKENTDSALRLLDVQGDFELPAPDSARRKQVINVDEDLLTHSLLAFDQQETFEEPFFSVRMIFDEFFTDLSGFQHHVDAGLLEVRDIISRIGSKPCAVTARFIPFGSRAKLTVSSERSTTSPCCGCSAISVLRSERSNVALRRR